MILTYLFFLAHIMSIFYRRSRGGWSGVVWPSHHLPLRPPHPRHPPALPPLRCQSRPGNEAAKKFLFF